MPCRTKTVYPRVYGGTLVARRFNTGRMGLSPRVRGNHNGKGRRSGGRRSIPACTGEPIPSRSAVTVLPVYPRVYGGTLAWWHPPAVRCGLSPRVRGNRCAGQSSGARLRSIPACTGEPEQGNARKVWPWVYPRVYGGTDKAMPIHAEYYGLSPRVRGNRGPLAHDRHAIGSIPACTGEPSSRRWARISFRVYPRVYGGTNCRRATSC